MMSLGFGSLESKQRILAEIKSCLRIKCDSPANLERIVISKFKSKGISKKCFDQLVTRLDSLENSIQESDDSEDDPLPKVKSEHMASVVKERNEIPDLTRSRISEAKMRHYEHYRNLMGQ